MARTLLYGFTDNITAGLIPRFFFDEPAGAANSSGVKSGDLTLQFAYGLTHLDGGHTPDMSTSRIGALLGVRIIEIRRNTTATVTPAIALNMVF